MKEAVRDVHDFFLLDVIKKVSCNVHIKTNDTIEIVLPKSRTM